MERNDHTPRWVHAFFRWYCQRERYEELHGDLEELYHDRLASLGRLRAILYYLWDVIRCFQPYAWKKFNPQPTSTMGMFRNFYFTAIRNLLKHKNYFMINISGLALGIASFTFISLYVINELSYDRFHRNHENTYRVSNKAIIRGEPNKQAATAGPMAKTLLNNYPEVLKATRILSDGDLLIGQGNRKINEEGVLFADAAVFEVFDFKLLKGDSKTALAHPRSMVLSETHAKKYFGNDDPMGQLITVEEDSIFYTVTGVVEDVPSNSHIRFDMLGSISTNDGWNANRWIGTSQHTYVVLKDEADVGALEEKMEEIFYAHMAPEIEYYTGLKIAEWEGAGNSVRFELMPIRDIHLHSESSGELEPTGNIAYIYIYGVIGLIILFIAIFNFVNLATAHAATRAKEVGVRKVIGSTKITLVYQFIFESIIVSLFSTLLAVILMSSFMPSFVDLIGKELAFGLTSGYIGVLSLLGLAILVGILAGFYPAFVLSGFRPVEVLKGTFRTGSRSGWLRNLLVTIQFAASIVIIIGTLVVYHQIDFMLSKNLGFDKDQTLVLQRPDWLNGSLEVFKDDLLKNPNIRTVSNSETIPGKSYQIRSYRRKDDPETFLFLNNQVSYEYADLMGFELIAGRFFSREFGADSNAVVLNESAAKLFGYDDPVGKSLTSAFKKGRPLTIIGVVKDYHTESLHKQVAPVSLELAPHTAGYLSVSIHATQNIRRTIESIEDTWDQYAGSKPLNYFFFDEDYQQLYRSESTTGQVLLVFATLSILIACMGLIGLITYTAAIRKKEIGIRKVLGAGAGTLVRLLSGEIALLIVIAILISWPLAYLATDYWLQNFANRVAFQPWIYMGSTLAVVLVVGVAIGFQVFRTALSNPVDSLRDE